MDPQLSVPCFLLLFVRTLERHLSLLDSAINNPKRKSPLRYGTCPCIFPILEAQQRLESNRDELLKEVENALKKASLVWSTARPSDNVRKEAEITEDKIDPPQPRFLNEPARTSKTVRCPNSLPKRGSKVPRPPVRSSYKPVYQMAPYRTEPERTRKPIRTKHTDPYITPDILNTKENQVPSYSGLTGSSDTRRQLLLDDKATTVDNSEQNNGSTLASHEPIDKDHCYAEQENPDCKPVCVCFEKRLVEAVKLYESNILPLNAALKSYDFTPSTTVSANFERELYTQLVAGQDYRTLSRCLVQKYEATRHCFLRFIQLIDVTNIDTLDGDQLSWMRSMFTRFYRLRDLLHLAHVRFEKESNLDEAAEDTEGTAIDPLGCWLDTVKPKQTCDVEGLPSSCQLMNAYLSMGSFSSPLSRVFMLTGLPELCTFSGSSNQLFEFVRLWDSLESLQFELHLLKILHTALPKLLEQLVPRSDRVSAFRQLYGLVCSFHPIALKDNLHM
ncbi:hypothetical protein CRM22_009311 [Opisthorchis felineus]|uniref:Uncharacterized protein n=1 Tax=Opisthorchis felineus TaxID=147828 RepID=A0A4S2L7E4_OPIFE|nr:hypothetical protein CRM22_009311 [Opisthorchis felineus]